MRILGAAVGLFALTAAVAADAGAAMQGSNSRPVNTGHALTIVQMRDGNGSGWHPTVRGNGAPTWHPTPGSGAAPSPLPPGRSSQWGRNWVEPHWAWNHHYGVWGPPSVFGGPYTILGGPYAPYRSYGDWGALEYPYSEWREPRGGWGNP